MAEKSATQEQFEENVAATEQEDMAQEQSIAAAEEIARLQAELATVKDQALRTLAEADNIRKRSQRETEEKVKYAVTSFARDLLAVADNFARAVGSAPQAEAGSVVAQFVEGITMTEKELLDVFRKHGIEKIEPMGEMFDHNLHQAVVEIPSETQAAGMIVTVMQAGYTLQGRLLRPAMVGVAKAAANPSGAQESVDTQV